jgi:hypothetical protein
VHRRLALAQPARGVGHGGGLDLDHVGPQLGQGRAAQRARDDHAEGDHLDPGQRARRVGSRPWRRSPFAGDLRGIMLAEPGRRAPVLREQRLPRHERPARDVELAEGG